MKSSTKSETRIYKKIGSGDPPLLWSVEYLPVVRNDSDFLNDEQYWHVRDQLMELARCSEPTKCDHLDIAPIGDFWELKDKGGVLGKINLRVFFITDTQDKKAIIVLGVHKKEDDRQLRNCIVRKISRRRRLYKECQ